MFKLQTYNISKRLERHEYLFDDEYFSYYVMRCVISDYNLNSYFSKNLFKYKIIMSKKVYYKYLNSHFTSINLIDNFILARYNNFNSPYYIHFADLLDMDEVLFSDDINLVNEFLEKRRVIKERDDKLNKIKNII